jgi:four helix bundle protein
MATSKCFEDLDSWKLARELCQKIGRIIDQGRFKRSYKLIDQVEASSGSIMDNIAEGFERGNRNEFITFLGYSKGSCGEFRSQMYRALDRQYISQHEFAHLCGLSKRISAMLHGFIEYLQKTTIKGLRKKEYKSQCTHLP